MSLVITILYGLAALAVLILIHEFGHFIVAKMFGVRVETFSIGFGKGILKFKKGDTLYQIGYIPLGGYCKMAGEEPTDDLTGADYEFYSKSPGKRLLILFAGPFMNYLLGIILLMIIYSIGNYRVSFSTKIDVLKKINISGKEIISPAYKSGLRSGDIIEKINNKKVKDWMDAKRKIIISGDEKKINLTVKRNNKILTLKVEPIINPDTGASLLGIIPYISNKIDAVLKDSPADRAGLKKGDIIIKINNKKVKKFIEIRNIIKKNPGKILLFTIKRGKKIITKRIKLAVDNGKGLLGVSFKSEDKIVLNKSKNIFYAFVDAFKRANRMVYEVIYGLKIMVSGKVKVRKAVSGPAKIVYFAGETAQKYGFLNYIFIVAYISIALAFFNLLPIPAVDGSYILFFLFEFITGKDLNYNIIRIIQNVGLILITILGVLIIFNDILSLSSGSSNLQQAKDIISSLMI